MIHNQKLIDYFAWRACYGRCHHKRKAIILNLIGNSPFLRQACFLPAAEYPVHWITGIDFLILRKDVDVQ
jgi:hypothetical protein